MLDCIVHQCHHSLAMRVVDLRARQIERVGRAGRVPVSSRVIVRDSLTCLQQFSPGVGVILKFPVSQN